MLNKFINVCRVVCFSDEDKHRTAIQASFAPFEMRDSWKPEDDDGIPTLLIGWNNVKSIYPKQNILVAEIGKNVSWTHSESEDQETFKKDVEAFVKNAISLFFNVPYVQYDSILDGDFIEFARNRIKKTNRIFVYFKGKAMYVFDGVEEFGFSLESMRYCDIPVKDAVTGFLSEFGCVILCRDNASLYAKASFLKRYISIDNVVWTKFGESISENNFDNLFIDYDIGRHIPFMMSMIPIEGMSSDEVKSCFRHCIKDAVELWLSGRKVYFKGEYENQRLKLVSEKKQKYAVLGYSAKRTITGRINCTESAFNPQNIPKESPDRAMVVSRFEGGQIAIFDYVSFETKLAMYMCGDKEFINDNWDKDVHIETAKRIFKTKNPSTEQRSSSKNVNHALLYGGGEERLENILHEAKNPKVAVDAVRNFLKPIIIKSEEIFLEYDKLGYIANPFGTLVRVSKKWAAFNNYIQSTAADIVTDKIMEIATMLNGMKSQFLFQVHDSFVFDIHPSEIDELKDIAEMLSKHEGAIFQVEITTGASLADCSSIKSAKTIRV